MVAAGTSAHDGRMQLLCGIDDSAPGRNAAYVAGDLAQRLDASLTLLHVVSGEEAAEGRTEDCGVPVHVRAEGSEARRARTQFGMLANDVAAQTGARLVLRIETGDPAERLLAAARELGADLVVIGRTRRGRVADLLVRGVHARLLADSEVPVAVVPPGASLPDDDRIVLACRRSSQPQRSATLGGRLAALMRASLVVTQVLPERRRDGRPTSWEVYDAARRDAAAAAAAAADDVDVECVEYDGEPAEVLARAPDDLGAALVVVGRPERPAWQRLVCPPVAEELAHLARHPVIVVPAGEDRAVSPLADRPRRAMV
jgi:nucleotide-binding universal stress UspA family protein